MLRNRTLFWLIVIVFLSALFLPAILPEKAQADPGWYDASWLYRKKITINSANVSANLTDFPMLVNLSSDTDLGARAQSDGDDILFTAADEVTKLNHEIGSFNGTSGELVAWVKIPTLSSLVDTDIYMYYGNSIASNQENATAVWDANFVLVDHMKDDPNTSSTSDSTNQDNDGAKKGANEPAEIAGKVGKSQDFEDSGDDYIDYGSPAELDLRTFTYELFLYPTTVNDTDYFIVKGDSTLFSDWSVRLGMQATGKLFFWGSTGTISSFSLLSDNDNAITANAWNHIAVIADHDNTTARTYINGVQDKADT